jgi:hypothetical protein
MSRNTKSILRSGMALACAVMAMAAGMWLGNVAYAADCCRISNWGYLCSVSEQSCPNCNYTCTGQRVVATTGYMASWTSSSGYDECCSSNKTCAYEYDCVEGVTTCPGGSKKECTADTASSAPVADTGKEYTGSGTCP